MKTSGDLTELYAEKLWPSPWMLLAITPLGAALWLVTLPFTPSLSPWLGSMAVAVVWLYQLLRVSSISVTSNGLQAGVANLPTSAIGEVRALRGSDALAARGPELNPRAFKLFRGGISSYVAIEVLDSHDPTPYWIIASRQPELLQRAMQQAKA